MSGNMFVYAIMGVIFLGMLAIMGRSRLGWICTRVVAVFLMMIALNQIIPNYQVAINPYTMGFGSVLGVPGVMTLYILQLIF